MPKNHVCSSRPRSPSGFSKVSARPRPEAVERNGKPADAHARHDASCRLRTAIHWRRAATEDRRMAAEANRAARRPGRRRKRPPRRRALGGETSKPLRLSRTRPIARSEERAFFERPMRRAAARRSPQAILDSRSGLEKWAQQELDGEARYAKLIGQRRARPRKPQALPEPRLFHNEPPCKRLDVVRVVDREAARILAKPVRRSPTSQPARERERIDQQHVCVTHTAAGPARFS